MVYKVGIITRIYRDARSIKQNPFHIFGRKVEIFEWYVNVLH
jgi:hypothetical protein